MEREKPVNIEEDEDTVNDAFTEYFDKFGDFPFIVFGYELEDEAYQTAMRLAVEKGTPITAENVDTFRIGKLEETVD